MVTKKEARKVSIYSAFVIAAIAYATITLLDNSVMINSLIIGAASGVFSYFGMINGK